MNAKIFYKDPKLRDFSPFFIAIDYDDLKTIEIFCDHGKDINLTTTKGYSPMLYAAKTGHDDISMYLSMRSKDIDREDPNNG